VFRLEAGGADPSVGIVQKLAKALGVPITALLS
jgi:transcriptional regulator with XRE-family HTH domain